MTQNSDPYENAIAERINGILKDEFGMDCVFENYEYLKVQLSQSIELYNSYRPHLSINYKTPNQAHNQNKIRLKTYKSKKSSKLVLNSLDY